MGKFCDCCGKHEASKILIYEASKLEFSTGTWVGDLCEDCRESLKKNLKELSIKFGLEEMSEVEKYLEIEKK